VYGFITPPVVISQKEATNLDKMKCIDISTKKWMEDLYSYGCKVIDEAMSMHEKLKQVGEKIKA